jgi:hypothetical protein
MASIESPFEQLVANALDFAEASIRQLESEPKFSAINFYTSLELFLKARLVHEHWSLAVSNLQKASKEEFHQADFQSIGLDEAKLRIKNTLPAGEALTDGESKAYEALRRRRNKAVHFYHPDYLGNHRSEVAVEQFIAWRHLHQRLKGPWAEYFVGVAERIESLNGKISKYQSYLDAVFDEYWERTQEANRRKLKAGRPLNPVGFCVSCEKQAVEPAGRHTKHILAGVCQVCDEEQLLATFPCRKCGNETAVSPWKPLGCLTCGEEFQFGAVSMKEAVDAASLDESWGFCHLCDASPLPTVMALRLDDGERALLCSRCLDFEKGGWLDICDWCGAMVTGSIGTERDPGCIRCAHAIEEEAGAEPRVVEELPMLENWRKAREYYHMAQRFEFGRH